jgi:lipopolysaccharide biosynthesis glycosyltransferase
LALLELSQRGLYTRPTVYKGTQLWDGISDAPMTTEHAISRFFVPLLAQYHGWALFTDGDVLFRRTVNDLFALADPKYALMCVQHPPDLFVEGTKKNGAPQTVYPRKNWSSVMLFNCGHPANRALTVDLLNSWPGRDLHAFKWLNDDLIGELPPSWNYLVGVSPKPLTVDLVHFTLGTPNILPNRQMPYADEWWKVAHAAGYQVFAGV